MSKLFTILLFITISYSYGSMLPPTASSCASEYQAGFDPINGISSSGCSNLLANDPNAKRLFNAEVKDRYGTMGNAQNIMTEREDIMAQQLEVFRYFNPPMQPSLLGVQIGASGCFDQYGVCSSDVSNSPRSSLDYFYPSPSVLYPTNAEVYNGFGV